MIKMEFIGIYLILISILYSLYQKRYKVVLPLIIVLFSALYLLSH